jgi:superfamily II DNA helicase RecQ
MKLQYASYLLPLYPGSAEQEELNRFLRGHRIVQTRKELVAKDGESFWALLVEYLDHPAKNGTVELPKGKIDYKEILDTKEFSLFSKLRETRKKLSEENGLPVYAVCTNEQLAEMAKRRPKTLAEFMKIDGLGQGKAEKYAPALLECIKTENDEDKTSSF